MRSTNEVLILQFLRYDDGKVSINLRSRSHIHEQDQFWKVDVLFHGSFRVGFSTGGEQLFMGKITFLKKTYTPPKKACLIHVFASQWEHSYFGMKLLFSHGRNRPIAKNFMLANMPIFFQIDPWCSWDPEILAADGTHIGVGTRFLEINNTNCITAQDSERKIKPVHRR